MSSASTIAKTELTYFRSPDLTANNDLLFSTIETSLEDAVGAAANFSQAPFFFDQTDIVTPDLAVTDLVSSSSTSLPLNSIIVIPDREWLEEVEAKAKLIDESSEVAEEMIESALTALEELKTQSVAAYDQIVEETKAAVEGADNAIARRLRVLPMTRRAPGPVTPAEPQNTPIALAVKACRERDEAAEARDEVRV